jgi:hypothetical protein
MEPEARENPTALSKASSGLTWIEIGMRSLHRERVDLHVFLTRVAEQATMLIEDDLVRFIFDSTRC